MKLCPDCQTQRPHSEFHPHKLTKDGLNTYCKRCDKIRGQAWQETHRDSKRNAQLKYRYGLTVGQYFERLEAQGGGCAVCGRVPDPNSASRNERSLQVDHNHSCCTGRRSCGECIRGLLCAPCNKVLGMVNESVLRLKSLQAYLERYGASDA